MKTKIILILLFMYNYLNAQNNFYEKEIISEFKINDNKSINVRKTYIIYKDSIKVSEFYHRYLFEVNDKNIYESLKNYEDFLNIALETWKNIPDSTGFFPLNEETDSVYYLGNWRINVNNVITNGKIKLNTKGKYIFDPNLNQPLIENIPLTIKTNLIKIKINNIDFILIKNDNGKYISNDKNVKLTKIE